MINNTKFTGSIFSLIAVLAIGTSLNACSSKKAEEAGPTAVDVNNTGSMTSDSGNAEGLQTITFPYDSFVIDSEAKATLAANASIMKDKASLQIQVEGHCDERGGIQYNLALGEKRAAAVRKYLIDQGVAGSRVTTVSYGKERPVDSSNTEAAWAKNRRANFVITTR